MFQTKFEFYPPQRRYLDSAGNLHRTGVMRLAKAIDEITPLRDPRVQANPAYATVIILSRVVTQLGTLEEINTAIIEDLFAADLNYLYTLYRQINDLEENPTNRVGAVLDESMTGKSMPETEMLSETPLTASGTRERRGDR